MPANRRDRRRFKHVVLWSIAGIALIQLGLGAFIETRLLAVRDPEYVFRESRWRERLAEHPNQKRLLFLGSSRVACGIDAEQFTDAMQGEAVVFNFGIPKAGPFSQRVYLERLHASGLVPDVVVIEIMVPLLCGKETPFEDRSLDGERFALSELADVSFGKNFRGAYRKWLYHRAVPVPAHGAELRRLLGIDALSLPSELERENSDLDPYGWRATGLPPERQAEVTALAHRQYDACYRSFEVHPDQARRLDELIVRCTELGATPILLLMPEGSEFGQLLPPEGETHLQRLIHDLQSRHAVRAIDARKWMPDNAFIDMHHLDGPSAIAFSERLAREVIADCVMPRKLAKSTGR